MIISRTRAGKALYLPKLLRFPKKNEPALVHRLIFLQWLLLRLSPYRRQGAQRFQPGQQLRIATLC